MLFFIYIYIYIYISSRADIMNFLDSPSSSPHSLSLFLYPSLSFISARRLSILHLVSLYSRCMSRSPSENDTFEFILTSLVGSSTSDWDELWDGWQMAKELLFSTVLLLGFFQDYTWYSIVVPVHFFLKSFRGAIILHYEHDRSLKEILFFFSIREN